MEYKTGCIIDENISKNNYNFNVIKNSNTKAILMPTEYVQDNIKIYDQMAIGQCVAISLANGRRNTELNQSKVDEDYSSAFIYANRLPTDTQDEGLIPEQALSNLIKCGTVKKYEWIECENYSTLKYKFDIDKETLLPMALKNRISSYYEIKKESYEDIKLALFQNLEVYIVVNIYSSFYNAWSTNKGTIPDYDINEIFYGSHMMRVVGYDKYGKLKIANSWGCTNGDNGYCYIHLTSNIINKIYVAVDTVYENKLEDLKFIACIDKYSDLLSAQRKSDFINNMKLFGDIVTKVTKYDNCYYIQVNEPFNNRTLAIEFKNNSNIKDIISIIPICLKSKYVVYMNINFTESQVNNYINIKILGDYNYLNYKIGDNNYIAVVFNSMQEAETQKINICNTFGIDASYFSIVEIE